MIKPSEQERNVPQGGVEPAAERRQLTIMFVDVVGSTTLSSGLDPEEFLAILRQYCSICDEQVRTYGGQVARVFGDGILAFFGVPRAHEDDPERAIHAAMSIIAALKDHEFTTSEAGPVRLAVRIAVNTGLVVVSNREGNAASGQSQVFGNVAHVAARLQALASPNGIVIGRGTHDLLHGAFRCDYLGERKLAGVKDPIACWSVIGATAVQSRFERRRSAPLTPMVGRASEQAQLMQRWEECRDGSGCVVAISGDPGIGKSRLVHAFGLSLGRASSGMQNYQCSPFHVNTPLHPFIEQSRRWARIHDSDSPARALEKLRAHVSLATDDPDPALPYFAALLSIPAVDGFEPADLQSLRERERALETITSTTVSYARRGPLLFIVEDVQWIDPTSVEFLKHLVARTASEPIMVVITHRSGYSPDWLSGAPVHTLALSRLAAEDCERMVDAIVQHATLPKIVRTRIIEQTDRVPLFIEEFTRSVLDSGLLTRSGDRWVLTGIMPDSLVPATIQDSLMERLDRLGQAKHVAQVASVFGRRFQYDGLQSLTAMPDVQLMGAVAQLEAAGIIRRHGDPPQATFVFRHAMLHEAAYASLLREERRELHARAAAWLRHGGSMSETAEPAVLGHHYSRAGMPVDAVAAWLEAGTAALRRSALTEAVAHLRDALSLLSKLPAAPERYQSEIQIQICLAMAYTALAGWAQESVTKACTRVLELCDHHGTAGQKSIALWGVTIATLVAADLPKTFDHAQTFVALGEDTGDDAIALMAHAAALLANFYAGRFLDARASVDFICARYDARIHGNLVHLYQHDPRILALVYAGHIEWLLGRPRRGRACAEEARRLARRMGHPFMLAFSLIIGAADHYYEGDLTAQLALQREAIAVAQEHGLRLYDVFGPLWAIEAVAADDPRPETLEHLCKLASRLLHIDAGIGAPFYQIRIAREFDRIGVTARARELAASAEAIARRTDERWFEPELYRIQAELLTRGPTPDWNAAFELFERSLASAAVLQAPGWELRTAMSLARALVARGRGDEAPAVLARARRKFASDETSADLREADILGEQLTAAAGTQRSQHDAASA